MSDAPKSNAVVIRNFFGNKEGQTTRDFIQEFAQLSDEEREQLGEGIRNKSLTY